MVLLFDDSSCRELMRGTDLHSDAERIAEARGHIRKDPRLFVLNCHATFSSVHPSDDVCLPLHWGVVLVASFLLPGLPSRTP